MFILKRDGKKEAVQFDKILNRLKTQSDGLTVKFEELAQKTISLMKSGMKSSDIDLLTARLAAGKAVYHPDYLVLAARINMSNLHKSTTDDFAQLMQNMSTYTHREAAAPLVDPTIAAAIAIHKEKIHQAIDYQRDYLLTFFSIKTLKRSYLYKMRDEIVERPQHMWMRVACGIHTDPETHNLDVDKAIETYHAMSQLYCTHATPTLFNSGSPRPQLSSCFLLTMQDDSLDGIFSTLKQCAHISKYSGGIGLSIHNIRGAGSYIKGTAGKSTGIVPMLKVFNDTARYINQGGRRNGSFAIYMEPWHVDIMDYLQLKLPTGGENARARDLFYALWVPDLFMKRVKADESWSLFCPDETKGLHDVYGEKFEELYERYEKEGRARKTMRAQEIWYQILKSQIETGTPYMLYKDACNRKSNQQNLGTIRSSNLCAEVVLYTSPDEIAVCNLASVALPKFVREGKTFDFIGLEAIVRILVRNLDKVIDVNFYPVMEAQNSNKKHRPIGIGIQGLATTFIKMRYPFESENAKFLNKSIFETIYYSAIDESANLAKEKGSYSTFAGSPASKGLLQFDLWEATPSERYDWEALKEKVMTHGLRNSVVTALMPTASTSQILGNSESFDPLSSNLYTRRTLAGEFTQINEFLVDDLISLDMWNDKMRNLLMKGRGSVQHLPIPDELKQLYKTVWEISQKQVIQLAADRGIFICQSQSMNLYFSDPTASKLSSAHMYAWGKGLKTGMYYLRSRPAADAIQFTVEEEDECVSCGS